MLFSTSSSTLNPKEATMSLQATVTAYFAIFIVFANAQIMHDPNYCQSHDPIRPQRGMRSTLSLYEVLRKPAIDPNASGKFKKGTIFCL